MWIPGLINVRSEVRRQLQPDWACAFTADLRLAGIIAILIVRVVIPHNTNLGTACRIRIVIIAYLRIMANTHSYFIFCIVLAG